MLHAFSAGADGELTRVGFELSSDTPYIKVDKDSLRPEHKEIAHYWNNLIEGLEESVPKLAELPDEISRLSEEAQSLPEKASESAQNNNLSVINKGKALMTVGENVKKLSAAPKILEEVTEFQKKIISEIQVTVSGKLKNEQVMNQIRDIGQEAYRAGVFSPELLITRFWPDQERVNRK